LSLNVFPVVPTTQLKSLRTYMYV